MWITANSKVMRQMTDESKIHFDVRAYLQYTKMVGELAASYTWQSLLLFDDQLMKSVESGWIF